jgi:hypothetical protein
MAKADPRVDAEGVVVADVPCIGCGYNLRSLSRDANCPECGKAVVASLRHDDLALADPAWLEQVASGTQRVGLALVAVLVLVAVGFVLPLAWPLVAVIAAIGYWRIATAEPGVLAQEGYRSRLVLRVLAVILGLASVGCVLVTGLAWLTGGEMFYIMMVFVFVLMAAVLQPIAIVLVEQRVHSLQLRVHRDRRLKQTRWVLRGFAATLAVWLVGFVPLVILADMSFGAAFGGTRAPFADMALAIVGVLQFILSLVLAVGLIWSGVLLQSHAKLFREVRRMAMTRVQQTVTATTQTEAGAHGEDANQS